MIATALGHWERLHPYLLGATAAILGWQYGAQLTDWANSANVDVRGCYSAVFNVSTVLTAFLFSFFGLAVAPGGGFIERIFHTQTFRLFLRYIAEALVLGTCLTLFTIPFMVSDYGPLMSAHGGRLAFAVWAFLCAAAFVSFFRVARVFLIWIRARSAAQRGRLKGRQGGAEPSIVC